MLVIQNAIVVDRVAKANQKSESKVDETRPQESADAASGTRERGPDACAHELSRAVTVRLVNASTHTRAYRVGGSVKGEAKAREDRDKGKDVVDEHGVGCWRRRCK